MLFPSEKALRNRPLRSQSLEGASAWPNRKGETEIVANRREVRRRSCGIEKWMAAGLIALLFLAWACIGHLARRSFDITIHLRLDFALDRNNRD